MASRFNHTKKHKNKPSVIDILTLALARIFGQSYQTNTIELDTGRHEIAVSTKEEPLRIWFTFGSEDDDEEDVVLPVCQGNVDKVGYTMAECGFILYADIHSTRRKVRWFASF